MLNKFNNNFQNKPFHSHGIAHVANGGGIGAVSPETFTQRQQVHRNRQLVGGYSDSLLANGQHRAAGLKADDAAAVRVTTESGEKAVTRLDQRGFSVGIGARKTQQRSIPGARSIVPPQREQHRFTEPRHRYNPYQ